MLTLLLLAVFASGCSLDIFSSDGPAIGDDRGRGRRALERTAKHADHGSELVTGLMACGNCHGMRSNPLAPLHGGQLVVQREMTGIAPNLTPAENGLQDWSHSDIVRSMRFAVRPDGSVINHHFHEGYEWLSDRDLYAVADYLLSLPAVETPKNFGENNTMVSAVLDRINILPESAADQPQVSGYVAEISPTQQAGRAHYLVTNVARCASCHFQKGGWFSNDLALGEGEEIAIDSATGIPPSLLKNRGGLVGWEESDLFAYLKTGQKPGNGTKAELCPQSFYKHASDHELHLISAYIMESGAADE